MSTTNPKGSDDEEESKIDKILSDTEGTYQLTSSVVDATKQTLQLTELASAAILSIDKFLPLFKDIIVIAQEMIIMYQTAKTNKRICGVLLDRVQAAEAAVKNLEIRRHERKEFFNTENNVIIRKLVHVIEKISKYCNEIRELKGLRKYFTSKGIETTFKELTAEFDGYMLSLNFAITIESRSQADRDRDVLIKDINETNQLLQQLSNSMSSSHKDLTEKVSMSANTIANAEGDVTNIKEDVQEIKDDIKKVIVMLQGFEEFGFIRETFIDQEKSVEGGLTIDDIMDKQLNLEDFSELSERRGSVHKRIRRSYGHEVAFKEMNMDALPKNFYLEVNLLKRLQESRDIIQFFGLVKDKHRSKLYLVTEWAHHGNLREYYNTRKLENFTKIRLVLDIARGLVFLEGYKILHHDVRSANIMIDIYEHAKIANFGMSRGFAQATGNVGSTIENVRYMAPEKNKDRHYRYDTKCEVFSFGILMWEIADTSYPFEDVNEFEISDKMLENPLPITFKNDISQKWKDLVYEATNHDPDQRPEFIRILMKIRNLQKPTSTIQNTYSQKSDVKNMMSVEEAIKQHNQRKGDKDRAWKTLEFYSKSGDMTATYYKGYYLLKNLLKFAYSKEDRFEQAANLFKEAAEKGDILLAQLQYAICLYQGIGVQEDSKLAFEYFCKAAYKGDSTAMFNVGIMYYNGDGVDTNVDEGIYWIKLAAYHDVASAIEFLKDMNITI